MRKLCLSLIHMFSSLTLICTIPNLVYHFIASTANTHTHTHQSADQCELKSIKKFFDNIVNLIYRGNVLRSLYMIGEYRVL